MAIRRLSLVRRGELYCADAGEANTVCLVYVSNAQGRRYAGNTSHCVIAIPASVPQAAAWIVTRDEDTVYVSPPAAGLHWAAYSIQVIVPPARVLQIYDQM